MISNKNILVLSSITTFPVNTGGGIRSHFIIKELANHNNVKVFVPIARRTDFPRFTTFQVDCGNYSEIRYINYFLQGVTFIFEKFGLFGLSFVMFKFILKSNKYLESEIKRADIIFLNFPHLGFLTDSLKGKDIYYISHNIEYDLLKQNSKVSINFLNRFFIKKLKNEEKNIINNSNRTFVCTRDDVEKYKLDLGINTNNIEVLENGVDRYKVNLVNVFPEIYKGKNNKVIFVGSNFGPNIEAMKIIESLSKLYIDFNFFIVGTVAKGKVSNGNLYYLPDGNPIKVNTLIKYADYGINPVISGSGSNLKMIDYFIFGLPVITTSKGIRGFDNYIDILFDVGDFVSFKNVIDEIDKNRELYVRKGKNISHKYFWDDLVNNKIIYEK